MTTNEPVAHDHQLRRGSLGVFGVTFSVISAAAPLTAMAGGAPVAMLLGNGPGVPGAYLVTVGTLLLFSVGYTAMARHHTSTGAFYSYVARGLRQQLGGAAAYLALLSYNAMQIGLWGLFGAATGGFFADEFGITVDWWVYVLIGIALVAVLGYRHIDLSVKMLSVLVAAEFLVVLVLAVVIAVRGGDFGTTSLSATPLTPSALTSGSLPIALLCCTSVFAAVLAFHNAVARYTYALGREGLLPGRAGRTHVVHRSPHVGSVAQSVLASVVVGVFAVTGQDPVRALFTWLTNLGTLGVIALMAACSFAVVTFFHRHRDLDQNLVRTLIAPMVAGAALVAILGYAIGNFDLLISAGGVLVWLLPSLLLVAAAAGVVAALLLRARSPQRYAEMGRQYV
ncbi:APC family permease [Nocardia sp. NPDC051052]|uniref:APC family permease n=1 Tax=Nocardia sp. NPDC051052 TaxID=3364322 RepID=UPI0037A6B8B6